MIMVARFIGKLVVASGLSIFFGCMTLLIFGYGFDIVFNRSGSLPYGFYHLSYSRNFKVGDLVAFCPPDTSLFREARARGYISSGSCPGNFGRLLKQVKGLDTGSVFYGKDGVYLDGNKLPHSEPQSYDGVGRPLFPLWGRFGLKNGEVLLMTTCSDLSFDARYFGFIPTGQILGVLHPLWTWD